MATEDLSRTGLVHMDIKNPIPGGEEQLPEEPIGFLAAERASTSLVAGQTEVNPLATDLPDTGLMNALTEYTGVNFNSSLVTPTVIGSSQYMTAKENRYDADQGDYIPEGDYSATATFDQQMTDIIDRGQTDFTTLVGESYEDYRNRLKYQGPGDEFGIIMAGQEPFGNIPFLSTEEYVSSINKGVIGNMEDYRKFTYPPTNAYSAGIMVASALAENHFVKGVKYRPDKYMGKTKYIKGAESWFAKQAQKQFGAVFEENPTSAIKIAEANKAMYEYLQSTQEGQQKARDMRLNPDSINENYENAMTFVEEANRIAESYSIYQGKYSGDAEGVAAKKLAYTNMSQKDLDDTTAAGSTQYSGMAIGGDGVYVDISDGVAPGTAFKSGTIFVKWKKQEREERAKEEKKQEREERAKEKKEIKDTTKYITKKQVATEAEASETEAPYEKAPEQVRDEPKRGTGGQPISGPHGYQVGGPIGNPMGQQQEQQQQPIQDAGNLELIQEQGKDQSGVADDVKRDLNEGDFVINAPAMEMAGRGDIERMITKAITELQRKGVKLDFGQAAEDVDSIVQALVSNKEMVIPKVIAEQIGYDRLEKINNRGKQRVDEIEKEKAQQEKGFIQPNPQGQSPQPVQMGGVVTLEENKNQPIAVPRESFATMSSVGKRLLSPLSPEQADKELTELSKPSQSFEGFIKPIGMADGGQIGFTEDEISKLTMAESSDDTGAISPKGAVGKFQIMETGALAQFNRDMKTNYTIDQVKSDPVLNEKIGRWYLDWNLKYFDGNKALALAGYNQGPTAVVGITQGRISEYDKLSNEVKTYVEKILGQKPDTRIIPTIKPKPQQTGMMAVN